MEKNILWEEDEELFNRMAKESKTEAERIFFKKMKEKEETECTLSNDLILHEDDNEDRVCIVRVYYDEYRVLVVKPKIPGQRTEWKEDHVMNLNRALNVNLKKLGFAEDVTLGEWLKRHDYAHVRYDGNYDYE